MARLSRPPPGFAPQIAWGRMMRRTTNVSKSEEEDDTNETDDDDDGTDHEKEDQTQQDYDESHIASCIGRLKKAVQKSDEAIQDSNEAVEKFNNDIAGKWIALVKSRQEVVTEWHEQVHNREGKRTPRGGIRTRDQQFEACEVPQNKSFAVWA